MAWIWILIGAFVYTGLHSILAAPRIKQILMSVFGAWYRLVFNAFAIISLVPLLFMVLLLPDSLLYQVPWPWSGVMFLIQGGAALSALAALLQTGLIAFLGLDPLFGVSSKQDELLFTGGFYRWVRHPLYFFSLILLWATPRMTVNLFVLYLVFSSYLIWGTLIEEQKLIKVFGKNYRYYQQQVPMLIPWRMSRWLDK